MTLTPDEAARLERNEYMRRWRAANLEKARAYGRKHYAKNTMKVRAWQRDWARGNADKVRKTKAEWRAVNADKIRTQQRNWARANPHKARERNLKRKYGLTMDQWDAMFVAQRRRCAACPATVPGGRGYWHTDHCHSTGKVRGILCHKCNAVLGYVKDSEEILSSLLKYVREGGR